MIREALRYPARNRAETPTTVLLGGMLTFFTFLVLPQILILGYLVRVIQRRAHGDDTPPTFDGWGNLLVVGSKAYVIWLGWTAVPLLVRFGLNGGHLEPGQATFWLLGWMLSPNVISLLQEGAGRTGFLEGFGFTEPYLDLLIVLYLIPAALANYADHGTIRSGFFEGGLRRYLAWILDLLEHVHSGLADLGRRVLDRVLPEADNEFGPVSTFTDRRYAIAWAGYFLIWLGSEAVLQAFVYLPETVGIPVWVNMAYLLVALLVFFYLRVSAWSIIGRAWPMVRPESTVEGEHTEGDWQPLTRRITEARDHRVGTSLADRVGVVAPPAKTLLAGGLLLVFGIVVIPGLVVAGYLVRVLRLRADHDDLPLFSGFRGLLRDGIRAYLVWAGYSVLPVGLLFIAITGRSGADATMWDLASWGSLVGIGLPGGWPAVVGGLVGGVGVLLGVLVLLVTLLPDPLLVVPRTVLEIPITVAIGTVILSHYLVPAALVVLARTDSIREAFRPRAILVAVRQTQYARRWVGAMVVTALGWIAVFAINLALVRPELAEIALAEPIAGLEYLVFFSGPTSASALMVWMALVLSGVLYFGLLVLAAQLVCGAYPEDPA